MPMVSAHLLHRHMPLLLLSLLLGISFANISAAAAPAAQNGFDAYRQQMQQQYQSYRDERDKAFVEYLEKQWQQFETFKAGGFYNKPKPATLPAAPATEPVAPTITAPIATPLPAVKPAPLQPEPVIAVPAKPQPVKPTAPDAAFIFYGTPLPLNFDTGLQLKLQSTDKDGISLFWSQLSKAPHEAVVTQIQDHTRTLQLNDWGVYLLCLQSARHIQKNNSRESTLTTWFLLSKLGYQTKLAYGGNDVFLLAAVDHSVYQRPFLSDQNQKYYLMTDQAQATVPAKLYTYPGVYPDANRPMSFSIKAPPQLSGSSKPRLLQFSYGGQHYELKVAPQIVHAEHYAYLPQSDYGIYFKAAVDPVVLDELTAQLAPLLVGKSSEDAINLLLRFVQTAFDYKTDDQQFAYEKVMLPEETLYYPYSDCEDRTILFGYLVKQLLHFPVVALRYPDHLAAAVAFPAAPGADTLVVAGKTFVVTDPTYINANAGMTMPQYAKVKPEILEM